MIKKDNYIEILCFIFFCLCTVIISCFHEPWFDEFQAWGISKDSIYNILFVIPHIEGHPPLWHLILKCFSHFNVNCELGLKIPNLLFMFGAVWLLIFKSPFPRAVKLLLPFTYFIFYQYSIISRPYSIFCFAMFLAAVFYKDKDEHPFKFVFALALLCLSCAYGMVIAAGIIIAWFIQILSGGGISGYIKTFVKDKRFYAMFLIFLLCLCLAFIIYPDKEVIYNADIHSLSNIVRFFSVFFIIPADTLVSNILIYDVGNKLKATSNIFLIGSCTGLLINILLFIIFKSYKKLLYFFIPYLMVLIIFFKYAAPHHTGLLTIFYIFTFWCIKTECKKIQNKIINRVLVFSVAIVIIIQLYWSIAACINEIKYPYSDSRNIAEFIKKNKIDNYNILAQWNENFYRNRITGRIIIGIPVKIDERFNRKYEKLVYINIHGQNICAIINPYFNRNIFYGFNTDKPEKEYVIFKKMSVQEAEDTKQIIREKGIPDFIINQANLWYVFSEEELKNVNYLILKNFLSYKIWKDSYTKSTHSLYIREDLYNKLTEN